MIHPYQAAKIKRRARPRFPRSTAETQHAVRDVFDRLRPTGGPTASGGAAENGG